MIRKGRPAAGAEPSGRRFGVGDGRGGHPRGGHPRGGHPSGGDPSGGHPSGGDPLDPSSDYVSPDSSSPPSEQAGRSRRPTRSLKMRAIDYLSRREYSRTELSRKLAPFVEEGDTLDPLLDALEREGLLSDARFAESVMNRRSARMGASRIVGELRQHRLDDTLVESVASKLRDTERARALAVWRKKFGEVPQSPADRAKQARFLAMRGFSHATISSILKGDDDWSDE